VRRRRELTGAVGAVLTLAAILGPVVAEACAVCVGWGRENAGLNPGFYWSAVLLTMLPFVAVVVAGAWLHRHVSAAGRRSAPGSAVGPESPDGSG
jgi:hypothetical protein